MKAPLKNVLESWFLLVEPLTRSPECKPTVEPHDEAKKHNAGADEGSATQASLRLSERNA